LAGGEYKYIKIKKISPANRKVLIIIIFHFTEVSSEVSETGSFSFSLSLTNEKFDSHATVISLFWKVFPFYV